MANVDIDPGVLNESQQLALGTYIAVTNHEPSEAIPLLQRSQWNVQVCWYMRTMQSTGPKADIFRRLPLQNSSMARLQIQWKKPELL